jgi:hypothetical protein
MDLRIFFWRRKHGQRFTAALAAGFPGDFGLASRFLARGISRTEGVRRGLGYHNKIAQVFLDHLQEALRSLQD